MLCRGLPVHVRASHVTASPDMLYASAICGITVLSQGDKLIIVVFSAQVQMVTDRHEALSSRVQDRSRLVATR